MNTHKAEQSAICNLKSAIGYSPLRISASLRLRVFALTSLFLRSAIGNRRSAILLSLAFILHPSSFILHASGLPEPGLFMYGTVLNGANGNARITSGTLTWTITTPSGPPITISTPLTDISGQFSYVLRVPFETIVGSATLSPNTLQLNSATTSYYRTNVIFTFGSNSYPATISAPSLGFFTFNTSDRGRMEEVDLTVSAPGVGVTGGPPSFGSVQRSANGLFQMTVSGTTGQGYTLLASTNLVDWTPILAFTCTNSTMSISDTTATNFDQRFYRLGP